MVQYIRPPCRTWTMKLCFFRDLPMLFPWSLVISSHQMCPPQAHPLSSRLRLRKVISHERQLGQVILPFGENHLSMDINGVDFTFPDWIAGRYHCMKPGKPAVEPPKPPRLLSSCSATIALLSWEPHGLNLQNLQFPEMVRLWWAWGPLKSTSICHSE